MSTIKTDTLQNVAGTKSVPVNTVVDGSAKAWVNFNGTGTVAIRAAFNVGSITDNGVGDYTVNFTSALPDANYGVVGAAGSLSATAILRPQHTVVPTVAALRVITVNISSSPTDYEYVNIAVFR